MTVGATVHRYRPDGSAIGQLDLTDAAAANRRFEIVTGSIIPRAHRLFEICWQKSTNQAADIHIYRVDTANGNKAYLLEPRLGDTGTDGNWRPPNGEELIGGLDVHAPNSTGFTYRVQFGQTAGACSVDIFAIFKEV